MFEEHAKDRDDEMTNLMIHGLLTDDDAIKKSLLVIGCGPDPCKLMNRVRHHFDEIVVVEANPVFVASYKEMGWFKDNRSKIKLLNERIEEMDFERNRFDIIWMNHVIYYLRLDDIENRFLSQIDCWLKPKGHAMISMEPTCGPYVQRMKVPLKPNYNLSSFFRASLRRIGCPFFELTTFFNFNMTVESAKKLFKLFIADNMYHHPDYHQGPVTREDMQRIDHQIDKELWNVVAPSNQKKDEVMYNQVTLWFVIQKKRGNKTGQIHSKM